MSKLQPQNDDETMNIRWDDNSLSYIINNDNDNDHLPNVT